MDRSGSSKNGSKALGEDRGLDAASAIAATFTMFDVDRQTLRQFRGEAMRIWNEVVDAWRSLL